jgi:hypothetical protein
MQDPLGWLAATRIVMFVFIITLVPIPSITIASVDPETAWIGFGLTELTPLFIIAKGMRGGPFLLTAVALEATKGLLSSKTIAVKPISLNAVMRRIVGVVATTIAVMPSVAAVLLETELAPKGLATFGASERRHDAKCGREMRVIAIVSERFGCTCITIKLAAKPKINFATMKFSK